MSNESQEPKLLDHEYDGIQEYDNPMPRWWVYIFWATILYSLIYFVLPGDIGAGAKKDAMYAKEMEAWRSRPYSRIARPSRKALRSIPSIARRATRRAAPG